MRAATAAYRRTSRRPRILGMLRKPGMRNRDRMDG